MTALPTLLYGSEIWTLRDDEISRLESWQHRCLRYMMGIKYHIHGNVPGSELRNKCKVAKISTQLRTNRLRWFGHAARMPPERIPRKMLTAHLGRTRPKGRPRANWRQVITEDLKSINCVKTYPEEVKERSKWRKLIHQQPQSQDPERPLRRSTRIRLGRKK